MIETGSQHTKTFSTAAFQTKHDTSLWVDSPCSIGFCSKLPTLEKGQRFQFNSIYYRSDQLKSSSKQNEPKKPDELLREFRRSIKQASNKLKLNHRNAECGWKKRMKRKNAQELFSNEPLQSEKKFNIVNRLHPKEKKRLRIQYDKYGNRSSFQDQTMSKERMIKPTYRALEKMHSKPKSILLSPEKTKACSAHLFSESGRMDLARPENFNPGPGTYLKTDQHGFIGKIKKQSFKENKYTDMHMQKKQKSLIGQKRTNRNFLKFNQQKGLLSIIDTNQ